MIVMKPQARPGIALINVLVFAIFTTGFLVAGIQFTTQAMKAGRKSKSNAQVYNVALAGVTHATFWMQKQAVQPVEVFDPKSMSAVSYPDEENETKADEQQLGLVSEFQIDAAKNLWGRYEVGRSKSGANPAPIRSGVSQVGPVSPLYTASPGITWTAEDISGQRGQKDKAGSVWRIRSRAYIFERKDPTATFSLATGSLTPVRETLTLEAEVKSSPMKFRQACIYGWGAGLSSRDVDHDAGDDGTEPLLDGSGPAKGYQYRTSDVWSTSAVTTINTTTNLIGDTSISSSLADQIQYVFGVGSSAEVKSLAEHSYKNVGEVPADQPAMSLIYLKDKSNTLHTFNSTKALNGGGILFVDGNLKIDGSSKFQSWDGLVFVTGDFTLEESATINGAVMVGGHVFLDAASGKQPKIKYDASALANVSQSLGGYRMERSTLRTVDETSSTYIF